MMRVACATCAFFSPSHQPYARGTGQCRRNAPVMEQTDHGPRTIWPIVRDISWCGEHAVWDDAA